MSTIVIGAGLAGLTAAALLADGGEDVTVIEGRARLGGRATTDVRDGHLFNQGPHALYLGGGAMRTLRALGIDPPGAAPVTKGALGVRGATLGLLPAGPSSLARTRLLDARAKVDLARGLARVRGLEPALLADRSTAAWLGEAFSASGARQLVGGLVRVATYCADLDHLSADVGASQLQLALGGVRYLDGGWQAMVDALAARAERAGAVVRTGVRATAVEPAGGRWTVVTAEGGLDADRVIVAVNSVVAAATLTGSASVAEAARSATPVTAATLDVGLRRLPDPARRFAYGIDRPLYFSVHNPPAWLGEDVTLHVMKYLDTADDADTDAGEVRAELEGLLDLLQPGWRGELSTVRFQRRLVVTSMRPEPAQGGMAGRHPVVVADRPGLFVAGDWAGSEGHLADASIASAAAAVRAILAGGSGATGGRRGRTHPAASTTMS
ncbi:MAG: FAD-dependent oxidoreductase [Acidimicrobiia bacterium]|nr:FAD-dependent oxidoreductase [Acidimicrobiia bacterium]